MILAKWGGSLLTNKACSTAPRVRRRTLARLAREWGHTPGILVHGAGSFGHPMALAHRVGKRRLGATQALRVGADIQRSVRTLQAEVIAGLRRAGVPALGIPASVVAEARAGRVEFDASVFGAAVQAGCVPVTGGDAIADDRLGLRILSGDEILDHLAQALRPRRVVFATDVPGVLQDGRPLARVTSREAAALVRRLTEGGDATGGMRGKVSWAASMQRRGVECWIVDGSTPGVFKRALGPRPTGTRFVPARRV